jgi:curved DNA-binding protein
MRQRLTTYDSRLTTKKSLSSCQYKPIGNKIALFVRKTKKLNYKDYYKSLEVSKTATADEIKKSYRKLARKYHPDVNPGNKASEEKFKEISEAYEVLSNPENRKKYDQLGADFKKYEQAGHAGGGGFDWSKYAQQQQGRGGQYQYTSADEDFFGGGGGGGFSDFFENIFGGGFSGGARTKTGTRQRTQAFKGQDYSSEMEISLPEAYEGSTRILNVNNQQLRIKVKPGVSDGQVLKLAGKGGPGANGGPNGDLFLTVKIIPDPVYKRKGNDLHKDQHIDLFTALLGGEVHVHTLDGDIKMKIPAETQNGTVLRVKSKGFPVYGKADTFGDLYLKIHVDIPRSVSDEEKELVHQWMGMRKK